MENKNSISNVNHKSGFVSIIGQPNAGKSTLLNALLNEKIAIISGKPQTTRFRIKGVYNDIDSQIIFIDTPGIHKTRHQLGKFMISEITDSINDSDIILFLIDLKFLAKSKNMKKIIEEHIEFAGNFDAIKILVLNKTDGQPKENLMQQIVAINNYFPDAFSEIVPVSALKKFNIDTLVKVIKNYLPVSEKFYDSEYLTDMPEDVYISEVIREKIIQVTSEEIPHSVTCKTVKFAENKNGKIFIKVMIYAERLSQKKIIIGNNATLIKKIGTVAREELEIYFKKKIFLELEAGVIDDWREDGNALAELGYTKGS